MTGQVQTPASSAHDHFPLAQDACQRFCSPYTVRLGHRKCAARHHAHRRHPRHGAHGYTRLANRRHSRRHQSHQSHDEAGSDWPSMMRHVTGHPFFRHAGKGAYSKPSHYSDSASSCSSSSSSPSSDTLSCAACPEDNGSIIPPVDVFDTAVAYVVHVALPGTKRNDVGLSWHPDTSRLRISGSVRRPGDDLFTSTLVVSGRPVGPFDLSVSLPPAAAFDRVHDAHGGHVEVSAEVDADFITAKMEDGILVIVVPKLARDWTEVRRVDIE